MHPACLIVASSVYARQQVLNCYVPDLHFFTWHKGAHGSHKGAHGSHKGSCLAQNRHTCHCILRMLLLLLAVCYPPHAEIDSSHQAAADSKR